MKILLCCTLGMSSSIFVKAIRKEIKNENLDYTIVGVSMHEILKYIDKADVVLLAPHVKYMFYNMSEIYQFNEILILDIDMIDYGAMNAKNVLKNIQEHCKEY